MKNRIDKNSEDRQLSELREYLFDIQIEKIDAVVDELRYRVPDVMSGWNDLYQAKFHLSEDVAGKIDGRIVDCLEVLKQLPDKDITVYDHTVGCPTKCTYCGYNTISPPPLRGEIMKQLELKKREREILFKRIGNKRITGLYFGGGTPTVLGDDLLGELISGYKKDFSYSDEIEVTVEAHPATFDIRKLTTLANSGVNRLSIGVQSLDDRVLKHCNRNYSEYQVLEVVSKAVQKIGIVNVDLIYGLKGQSIDEHLQALKKLTYLGVEQFTIYAAWLKEGSKITREFQSGKFQGYASPMERAKMYLAGKYFLESRGYKETLSGWFSRNEDVRIYQKRWVDKVPCIGIGPGAYSYSKDWHYENVWDLSEYGKNIDANKLPVKSFVRFGEKEKEVVDLMWKLKSGGSFEVSELQTDLLTDYLDNNLLEQDMGRYRLTEMGEVVREWIIGDIIARLRRKD